MESLGMIGLPRKYSYKTTRHATRAFPPTPVLRKRGTSRAKSRKVVPDREETMRAAYYEKNGPAHEVLHLGEVETPHPGPGEVRVKLATSGVNPSDVKSRAGTTRKIAFARVIPHSDGAGVIDQVGDGVPSARIGERVWTWNAQWKRPFGTCAEHVVLPAHMAVRL